MTYNKDGLKLRKEKRERMMKDSILAHRPNRVHRGDQGKIKAKNNSMFQLVRKAGKVACFFEIKKREDLNRSTPLYDFDTNNNISNS